MSPKRAAKKRTKRNNRPFVVGWAGTATLHIPPEAKKKDIIAALDMMDISVIGPDHPFWK